MARKGMRRPTKLIDDMVTHGRRLILAELGHLGVTDEQAGELMRNIAHEVCWANAKQIIYVPEDLDLQLTRRDLQIWQDYQREGPPPTCARAFTAERVEELAAEHRLSTVQIYNIVRIMRRAEVAERQGVLPGLDPDDA